MAQCGKSFLALKRRRTTIDDAGGAVGERNGEGTIYRAPEYRLPKLMLYGQPPRETYEAPGFISGSLTKERNLSATAYLFERMRLGVCPILNISKQSYQNC
jgi:hypothetical protein